VSQPPPAASPAVLPAVDAHYFVGAPATDDERREMSVRLAGRDLTVEVASGVFSPTRLDVGTSALLKLADPLPVKPGANLLDVGCGWGPIAIHLALTYLDATVWAVDVSERALDLTRRNAERLGLKNIITALPDDVPAGVRFDAIWSNPPIRVGKQVLHDLLNHWIARLAEGGEAWLVVAKQLGADSLSNWITDQLGRTAVRSATSKGYRILRVT
jgi:16S rRNA G1207 methylase RsmC